MALEKRPVIIDCDPGTDDVTSIMMLLADPTIDVVGITPVGGNKEIETCTDIALGLCSYLGRDDIPVLKGADRPLFGPKHITVPGYCLGGGHLPETDKKVENKYAWDFIYEKALEYPGKLQILAIGPHMNLAHAIMKYPKITSLIERIVVMGGADGVGNITAAAEYNIWADPDAAKVVFTSGIPIVIMGLELCRSNYFTLEELQEVEKSGPAGEFLAQVIGGPIRKAAENGALGAGQFDPTAAAYMLDPSIYTMEDVHIDVETKGRLTRGKTVFTRKGTENVHKAPNGMEGRAIDREAFVALIKKTVAYWNERV